jgi:hypothetical protein
MVVGVKKFLMAFTGCCEIFLTQIDTDGFYVCEHIGANGMPAFAAT